jgi:hypothetical protein
MSKMATWRSAVTASIMAVSMGAFALFQQDLKALAHNAISNTTLYVAGTISVAMIALISNLASKVIVDIVAQSRRGKRRILGKTYLEGYWLSKTTRLTGDPGGSRPLTVDGIMSISHDPQTGEILPSVYRVPEDARHIGYSNTHSHVARIKENGDYVNFAEVNFNGGPRKLVAFGRFVTPPGEAIPQTYSGFLMVEGFAGIMQQTAVRMRSDDIARLKAIHGHDWMLKFLLEKKAKNVADMDQGYSGSGAL